MVAIAAEGVGQPADGAARTAGMRTDPCRSDIRQLVRIRPVSTGAGVEPRTAAGPGGVRAQHAAEAKPASFCTRRNQPIAGQTFR